MTPRWLGPDDVWALGWAGAVTALRTALADGLDPEAEPARTATSLGAGQLLTMPSSGRAYAGVKLVTLAAGNAARGLPRIHGIYVLFDAETLAPVATLDGAALTALRTPAVSALGVDLVAPANLASLLVFGTGPQARGHVHALRAVRPITDVRIVGRSSPDALIERLRAEGVAATAGAADDVARVDVVACCTNARVPLFDGNLLSPQAIVVACGSHEPDTREVDSRVVADCGVLVEARAVALREPGEVVQEIASGTLTPDALVTYADLVRGRAATRPRLVKTVGMGWQDLAVATAVLAQTRS